MLANLKFTDIQGGKKAEKKFCLPWDYLNDDHADNNSLDSMSVEPGSSVQTLPHEPSVIVATNITIAITITTFSSQTGVLQRI